MKDKISSSLQKSLEAQLLPNEKILWQQQPDPTEMARRSAFTPLTGLAMAVWMIGFSYMMILQEKNSGHGPEQVPLKTGFIVFLVIFMLPFAYGVYGALLAPILEYLKAKRTVYAITDKRVLKLVGTKAVTSFSPLVLSRLERTKNNRSFEDLIFYRIVITHSKRDREHCIGFEGLRNAIVPERLMLKLFQPTPIVG